VFPFQDNDCSIWYLYLLMFAYIFFIKNDLFFFQKGSDMKFKRGRFKLKKGGDIMNVKIPLSILMC
jgi:hypothetical protein